MRLTTSTILPSGKYNKDFDGDQKSIIDKVLRAALSLPIKTSNRLLNQNSLQYELSIDSSGNSMNHHSTTSSKINGTNSISNNGHQLLLSVPVISKQDKREFEEFQRMMTGSKLSKKQEAATSSTYKASSSSSAASKLSREAYLADSLKANGVPVGQWLFILSVALYVAFRFMKSSSSKEVTSTFQSTTAAPSKTPSKNTTKKKRENKKLKDKISFKEETNIRPYNVELDFESSKKEVVQETTTTTNSTLKAAKKVNRRKKKITKSTIHSQFDNGNVEESSNKQQKSMGNIEKSNNHNNNGPDSVSTDGSSSADERNLKNIQDLENDDGGCWTTVKARSSGGVTSNNNDDAAKPESKEPGEHVTEMDTSSKMIGFEISVSVSIKDDEAIARKLQDMEDAAAGTVVEEQEQPWEEVPSAKKNRAK